MQSFLRNYFQNFFPWEFFTNLENQLEDLPVLLWWTPFTPFNEIIECKNEKYKCLITSNRTINEKVDVCIDELL